MTKLCVECDESFIPGSEGEDTCLECWEFFMDQDEVREEEQRQLSEDEE